MIMEDFVHRIYVGSMQPSMHMDIWKGETFPTQCLVSLNTSYPSNTKG